LDKPLHGCPVPGAKVHVCGIILLRDRVSTDDHLNAVLLRNESCEIVEPGTGRITYNEAGGKVNDAHTVLYHLLGCILYVSARASSTGCKCGYLYILILISVESTLAVAYGPEALATGACGIPVAYNDTNPFLFHDCLLVVTIIGSGLQLVIEQVCCQFIRAFYRCPYKYIY